MGNSNSLKFDYSDFFQIANLKEKQEIASQQEILQQFNCTLVNHINKPIEGICLNEICKQQNRRTCFDCIIDRIHDNDNGKQSLIRNADQVELIIEKAKKFLNNQIDTCQFQLYYQQLKLCEETSDFVANKMLEQLNKMDYDMNQVQKQIKEINFQSYLQEQYVTNIGLFQYLKNYQNNIINIKKSLNKYMEINFQQKFSQNKFQQLQLDQNIKDDVQGIRKKKLIIINQILKTKYCKNGHLNDNQYEYLILNNDANINNYQQEIMIDNYDLLFQTYPKNHTFYKTKGILLYIFQLVINFVL